jgi:hypothetical protein
MFSASALSFRTVVRHDNFVAFALKLALHRLDYNFRIVN